MMKFRITNIFILFYLLFSITYCNTVKIVNKKDNVVNEIRTLDRLQGIFISINDVSNILAKRDPYINQDRKKMVLYIGDNRIKISSNSSYVIIDEKVYQIPIYPIWRENDIYISAEYFFDILKRTTLPGIDYDSKSMMLNIDLEEFSITGVDITQKANGTILRIKTKRAFPERDIRSFFHENGWF